MAKKKSDKDKKDRKSKYKDKLHIDLPFEEAMKLTFDETPKKKKKEEDEEKEEE